MLWLGFTYWLLTKLSGNGNGNLRSQARIVEHQSNIGDQAGCYPDIVINSTDTAFNAIGTSA